MATMKGFVDAGSAVFDDVGQSDAEGAEQAGVGMNKYLRDAELLSDGAGVLWGGSAEGDETIVARVVAFGEGDGADGLGHVGVGDAEEAGGDFQSSPLTP